MSYHRPVRWEPGTFLRMCDSCGIRFRAHELYRGADGRFRCQRWCQELTQLDRDRISAASNMRREAPPPPFGVPYVFYDNYGTESALLNFLAAAPIRDATWTGQLGQPNGRRAGAAPAMSFSLGGRNQVAMSAVTGTYSFKCAGETMRYLYQLITESKRPLSWIATAKAKLHELAEWIYSNQTGVGTSLGFTKTNSIRYGAVLDANSEWRTTEQARLAIGMLLAYQTFADPRYLASARGFADALVNLQSGGLLSAGYTTSNSAGTSRISYGTWMTQCNFVAVVDQRVFPESLIALEFYKALFAITGDELHGSDGTAGGVFISAPQMLLSTAMSQARAFWSVGAFDATTATTYTGLSTTTPKELFAPYHQGGVQASGSWEYVEGVAGSSVTAASWAAALRALYAFEGYSSQVSSIWTWLMAFTSNPSFQTTTTSVGQDAPTVLSFNGNYNPKLSLTTTLNVVTRQNASNTYDWQCAGYLAPIQGVQDPGSLDLAKDAVTVGATAKVTDYDAGTNGQDWIMLSGFSGLGGQTRLTTDTAYLWRADLAAAVGQMFRYGNATFVFQGDV